MIGRVLSLAVAVMKTTDLAKEVVERVTGLTPQPYLKSAFSMAVAGGIAVGYAEGWRDRLELAGAIAGTSAVLHEGHALLSSRVHRPFVVDRATRSRLGVPAL